MTQEEFLELNPCIKNYMLGKKNSKPDMIKQGQFLRNHMFIFKGLPEKYADIIKYRYGVEDGICRSCQEVADIYGVTREAIHDHEKRALRRLANRTYCDLMMKFDDNSANITTILEIFKKCDPKVLVNNNIKQAISTRAIRIIENVSINILNTRDYYKLATRKKLRDNDITTIRDLILYLYENGDLHALGIKPNSYENVIFAISDIVDSGSIAITSPKLFEEYRTNKAEYKQLICNVDTLVEESFIKPLDNWQNVKLKQQVGYNKIEDHKTQVKTTIGEQIGQNIVDMPIEKLGFGLRVYNTFRRSGIDTVDRLINYYYDNYNSFKSIKGLGDSGEIEVLNRLSQLGIKLNEESLSL